MIQRGLCSILLLTALFLSGCQSGPLDPNKIALIVPGRTTLAEAREILGEPGSEVAMSDRTVLRYAVRTTLGINAEGGQGKFSYSSFDLLSDETGIVQKVHRYESTAYVDAPGVSGRVTGSDLSDEALKRIESGTTSAARMRELFGPPKREFLSLDGTILRRWVQISQNAGQPTASWKVLDVEFDDQDVVFDFTTDNALIPL